MVIFMQHIYEDLLILKYFYIFCTSWTVKG